MDIPRPACHATQDERRLGLDHCARGQHLPPPCTRIASHWAATPSEPLHTVASSQPCQHVNIGGSRLMVPPSIACRPSVRVSMNRQRLHRRRHTVTGTRRTLGTRGR